MAYTNTIFNQLLTFLPKYHFNAFVGQQASDRYVKKFTTWNQLIALLYAQATGKESLRDIQTGLLLHEEKWSHLGVTSVARSTISYANNKRSYKVFENLFYELLHQCKELIPKRSFSFDNPLYSLDATVIRLCLSVFDWAKYTKTKGALKLHTLLDNRTMIPELIISSDDKKGDVTAGKEMNLTKKLEKGSIIVFDRAYVDYAWWKLLDDNEIYFVSRTKSNQSITVMGQHDIKEVGVVSDDKVIIGEHYGYEKYPKILRRVKVIDPKTKKIYEYLTNNFKLSPLQIMEIYIQRWQIELFFKWIKQNLKIKSFLGTSENAVLSQIWVAMVYYLLMAYIKFQTRFPKTLLELTRMVRETIFIRRNLIDMLSLDSTTVYRFEAPPIPQLALF